MNTNKSVTATGAYVTTVTSQANPLAYLKAIATLVGTVATGLLAIYTGDTEVGKVLTIVVIVATALTTWVVPNAPVVPDDVIIDTDAETDDGLTYEESGGFPFPTDADEGTLYGRPHENPGHGDAPDYSAGSPDRT